MILVNFVNDKNRRAHISDVPSSEGLSETVVFSSVFVVDRQGVWTVIAPAGTP